MIIEKKLVRFDWAIKNLLRDKANFDILEGFLSAILREEISVIEILVRSSNQSDFDKKVNRVDILVKDNQERKIIIEVQNHRETGYLERILWGVSKLIADNLELGEEYRNISRVISISILYFDFGFSEDEDYVYHGVTDFQGLHTHQPFTFRRWIDKRLKTLRTKDIFPQFYLIHVEHFQDVITTALDEWIYMLKHSAIRADFKSKNIDKVGEKLTLLKMSPEKRQGYEKYIMDMAVERDVLETARKEGVQEGLEKGERNAKLEMAKKMRSQGMDIETIIALTGLSPDVIKLA
jgi:predicted transposase/invertase (TIGR01784 family)